MMSPKNTIWDAKDLSE